MNAPNHPRSAIAPNAVSPAEGRVPLASPWGHQPICPGCNRGAVTSCLCGPWPEDDGMTPIADMQRINDRFYPERGWALAEKSALGMGEKL